MSASYFLSPHVHVCLAGKQVVLLDLERDKYLSLAHSHALGRWVRGWPVPVSDSDGPDQPRTLSVAEDDLLAKMISQGLVVNDPAVGKDAAPVVTPQPRDALVEYDLNTRPSTNLAQFRRLFKAHMAAKWSLWRHPIKDVVEVTSLRKRRASPSGMSINALRPVVAAFLYLRPWLYTSRNACLLDSLTLVNFLAGHGVFPQWIFGVKTDPFQAHCWVQQGDFVFNDTPDYVGGFTPILVV